MACKTNPDGTICPDTSDSSCSPWDLQKSNDLCFIDKVVDENLAIGGADINVFKLLGVHEQGLLVDLVGNGNAISGGDVSGFPASSAFEVFASTWRSAQQGTNVTAQSFIGYDFGEIKLDEYNQRLRYGIDTSIRHDIATVKIKQGDDAANRATRVRIERSDDNLQWFGVSIITLPDDSELNTFHFNHSVPSRYWRFRPVDFNGGAGDRWIVQAIEMMDYDQTSIDDIQDDIFLENRDRDYASESVTIKASYDLLDTQTELSRYGLELPSQQFYLVMSFSSIVGILGRPVVIGDIFELPSEQQYSATLEPIKKYIEVTDVAWSTEGYTPGWTPLLLRVIASPMLASQETQDIFGSLAQNIDELGLTDTDDGQNPIFQDISAISQSIEAEALTDLPERGRELGDVTQFTQEQIDSARDQGLPNLNKIGANPTGLYVEDAMPPNGIEYSQGDTLPENPIDGAYHRLTYTGLTIDDIPARLFRYSVAKGRWIFMETDRRAQYSETRPVLQEFLKSSTRKPLNQVDT